MSERKVLNKYFPPDFDPAKIPRRRMPKDEQHKVRLMAPFSMRCDSCGNYIYKGTKFNARKERVEGENYLGIQIFRFYIRCTRCSAEITFKTDPKNSDYVTEIGAQRNFEPWRENTSVSEEKKLERQMEEENNPIKALENRTLDSKREMDILDALDEIRTKNAQMERLDPDKILEKLVESKKALLQEKARKEAEEDDAIAKSMFVSADGDKIRRLVDDEDPTAIEGKESGFKFVVPTLKAKRAPGLLDLGVVPSRKKGKSEASDARRPPVEPVGKSAPNSLGLGGYGSDSD